ncbi:MAG: carbon-nitrogen hydrolase family protein [Gammaproteobacteria bacterium]|nr:carbon-nitrogen hydrolase family protein [Gammaproteobacteria bacterium]
MSSDLTVMACQLSVPATPTEKARERHVSRCVALIDAELNKTGADLVVLPELSTIEYSRESFECLAELAENADGPTFRQFRELAKKHNTTVVYGIPRIEKNGYRISQVVVAPTGELIGYYDKLHRAQFGASMENEYFSAGDRAFLFSVNGVKIAPVICYDIRFPELTRQLSVHHGAMLILHCGAYARDASFASWHAFAKTRAMENQVYLLSLNRAGQEFGHSIFCGPWIDESIPAVEFDEYNECFQHLTIDLERLHQVRKEYPFLKDRRSCYSNLL